MSGKAKSTEMPVRMESLESRELLSVSVNEGVLRVAGTRKGDKIVVSLDSDHGQFKINVNGKKQLVPAAEVDLLKVLGGRGNDTINVKAGAANAAALIARGGPGKNTLLNAANTASTIPPAPFTIYDNTLYDNKPDLARNGMQPIMVSSDAVYAGIWPNYDTSHFDEGAVRAAARQASDSHRPLILDIENLDVDNRVTDEVLIAERLSGFIQIVDWVHDERPDVKVGFYGLLPIRDYWVPISYRDVLDRVDTDPWAADSIGVYQATFDAWKAANDRLDELAAKVDIICPSLYTFFNDPKAWQVYAEENLAEARRYGKPVYAFLSLVYHDSNPEVGGQNIDARFFWRQLKVTQKLADSAIIWGGYQAQWDPNAPWWTATRNFMETLAA